ncbi:hypothetical protein E1B28_001419 [Marasmius oreades]|uniref:Homeobox domain-containing protein n=1 Tax=Marasmius oreades TaxID=181124 RepID=A0A9P7V3J6_9AGAR|nr:uncharacterized protein E1B28_001419 [Marasmius oreades]KAG7099589.1 hypothetical protein E1B28_001419 [Marasmius oreades]
MPTTAAPIQDRILATIDRLSEAIDHGSFDIVSAHWAQVGGEIRTRSSSGSHSKTVVAATRGAASCIEELCNEFTSFTHLNADLGRRLHRLSKCLSQPTENEPSSPPNPPTANQAPYAEPTSEWLLDNAFPSGELMQKLDRSVKAMFHTRFQLMKASLLEKLVAYSEQTPPRNESKRPFNHAYTPVLEKYFEFNEKPSGADRAAMAEKSGMTTRQIEVWFQNRRRRVKQQFGDKRIPTRCSGFSDEKLQKGLPVYLLQTGAENPVDLVERIVGAEWQAETRDLQSEKKYSSFHEPKYLPSPKAPNPLDTTPAPVPPPFKPATFIPLSAQFQNVNERPPHRFSEPQWSRRPHVLQPTVFAPATKPRGRAAQIAKASAQPEPPSEVEALTKAFEQFRIDHSGVPEEYRAYYFGQGPHLPPAATYAKDVRPPTGRHPAFVVPGSREIPKGLLSPLAMTPPRRKKAGLPRRTPMNPQRRRTSRSSPSSASSRSPSPPSSSRTPSLTSSLSTSTSSSHSLRRHSSVSSLSSDPDSPLFSPVSLPCDLPQVTVAGADSAGFCERDSLLLSPEQEGMKISFPLGFEAFTESSETAHLFEDIFHDTFADPVTFPPAAFQLTQHIP